MNTNVSTPAAIVTPAEKPSGFISGIKLRMDRLDAARRMAREMSLPVPPAFASEQQLAAIESAHAAYVAERNTWSDGIYADLDAAEASGVVFVDDEMA